MDHKQCLQALYARSKGHGIKLGLDVMRALCQALGHPERRMQHVVVAGTNGKGSTSHLIAQILQHGGTRVGLYTSPHLLRFAERIRINGVPVADALLPQFLASIAAVEAQGLRPATFFECATAMGLLAFAQHQVEMAVFEVGLGGRLDASNVVQPRALTVITPIDFDHQDYLGHTIEAIAGEKAAIIAPHKPVVVAPQPYPGAMQVIARVARERDAPLTVAAPLDLLPPGLPPYQAINLGVAQCAALALGYSQNAIEASLAQFSWPGRYQWIDGPEPLLLDGAHNPAGAQAFCDAWQADARRPVGITQLLFTALQNKDAAAMLRVFTAAGFAPHLCPVTSARSRTLAELQALGPYPVYANMPAALAAARQTTHGPVCVAGSLFLVADVLHHVLGLPRDPAVDG